MNGERNSVELTYWLRQVAKQQALRDKAHRDLAFAIRRAGSAGATEGELDQAQREGRAA